MRAGKRVITGTAYNRARYIVLYRVPHTKGWRVLWDYMAETPRSFSRKNVAESFAKLSFGPWTPVNGAIRDRIYADYRVRRLDEYERFLATQSPDYVGNLDPNRRYPVGD